MSLATIGRMLLITGLVLVLFGISLSLLSRATGSSIIRWFGNLPGDIVIRSKGITCLFPLASMLIVSIVLTIALNIIMRLINR